MSTTSPAAGWHADPYGRHQYRYWDGAQWTDQVANGGVAGVDPPAPSPPPRAVTSVPRIEGGLTKEQLLETPRLFFQSGGGLGFQPGYWSVADENRRPVAQMWRERSRVTLFDAAGERVFGAYMERYKVDSLHLLDAHGRDIANIGWTQAGKTTLRVKVGDTKMRIVIDHSAFLGNLEGIEVQDGSKNRIGTITEYDRQRSGLSITNWLFLDRQPGLVEPLRTMVTAAPVLVMCKMYALGVAIDT